MCRLTLMLAICIALAASGRGQGQTLEFACPPTTTVPCHQADNLDITGHGAVSGGCGPVQTAFRDSILAQDSLVVRIWTATDTCGQSVTCFQSIRLVAGKPRIAILPLENLAAAEDGARVLIRLLADAVLATAPLELIPPGKVDDALLRGRVRQPFLMDDNQRVQLAAAIDADYFVVGSLLNYQTYTDQYSGPVPMISCALQLQRAADGKSVWSESLHAVGNDGEWLFGMGVEHDITRLGKKLAQKAAAKMADHAMSKPCTEFR